MKRVFIFILAMVALFIPVTKGVKAETISTDNKVAYGSTYSYYDYDYDDDYRYDYYDYDDYYDDDLSDDAEAVVIMITMIFMMCYFGFIGLIWLFALAVSIYTIVLYWKLFVKAGKPGWAALIPIYNNGVFFEVAGLPGWFALFILVPIPFVNILAIYVIQAISYFYLVKKFNKEWWYGLIMLFAPIVGLTILVFDKNAHYDFTDENGEVVKEVKYKAVNKCSNCGEPLDKGDEFCTKCGTKKKGK